MSFKRAKVVMLPTNEKAVKGLTFNPDGKLFYHSKLLYEGISLLNPQHLYITINEKIEIGDWQLEKGTNKIERRTAGSYNNQHYKKIIATTDKLIMSSKEFLWSYSLPSPSDSFLKKFIDSYNYERTPKTNWMPITDILVEYETIINTHGSTRKELNDNVSTEERLKIDDKNTITIKKLKQTFTREELDTILLDVMNLGMSLRQNQLNGHDQRSGNEVLQEYKDENL